MIVGNLKPENVPNDAFNFSFGMPLIPEASSESKKEPECTTWNQCLDYFKTNGKWEYGIDLITQREAIEAEFRQQRMGLPTYFATEYQIIDLPENQDLDDEEPTPYFS